MTSKRDERTLGVPYCQIRHFDLDFLDFLEGKEMEHEIFMREFISLSGMYEFYVTCNTLVACCAALKIEK